MTVVNMVWNCSADSLPDIERNAKTAVSISVRSDFTSISLQICFFMFKVLQSVIDGFDSLFYDRHSSCKVVVFCNSVFKLLKPVVCHFRADENSAETSAECSDKRKKSDYDFLIHFFTSCK